MNIREEINQWCESMKDKPVGGMNQKEMLAWFIAYQEAECLGDMTQKEMAELLLEGTKGYGEFTMEELVEELVDAQEGGEMEVIKELNKFYNAK